MQMLHKFLTFIELLIIIILSITFPPAMEHGSDNYNSKSHKDPVDDI